MQTTTVQEIYQNTVRPLSNGEKRQLAELILQDVEQNHQEPDELTPEERSRRWLNFVEKYAVRAGHFVDDSREAIYEDR